MQTHDEETRKFFKHSSVTCVLSPRYASSKLSIFKQQARFIPWFSNIFHHLIIWFLFMLKGEEKRKHRINQFDVNRFFTWYSRSSMDIYFLVYKLIYLRDLCFVLYRARSKYWYFIGVHLRWYSAGIVVANCIDTYRHNLCITVTGVFQSWLIYLTLFIIDTIFSIN